jgi:alpha-beta hydrolase superfamily lysophospholipase
MVMAEGWIGVEGDLRLYHRWWLPSDEPRAVLAITHGVGEHGGRYAPFAGLLTARGVAVHSVDLRGHGRSDGVRVHVDRWNRYKSDVAVFLRAVAKMRAGCPIFLFGHSLGALIALDYALDLERNPTDGPRPFGLISSSTAIEPHGVAKPHLVAIARLLSRVAPRVSLDLAIDPVALSRDPAVARAYREDPLVHRRATVRWGTEVLAATASIKRRAAHLGLPLLVCHGTADRLTSPAGSRWLAGIVSGTDVELTLFEGAYHEPHNDLCAADVAEHIVAWMKSRIA